MNENCDKIQLEKNINKWYKQVIDWFTHSDEKSNMLIDSKWHIIEKYDEKKTILVGIPELPFPFGVRIGKTGIKISIFTKLETYNWEKEQKAEVFRSLLVQNDESYFIKFVLGGRNDEIVLRVDLDMVYLNKNEFNNALQALKHGGNWCLDKFEGMVYPFGNENGVVVEMDEEKALETLKLGIQIDLNRGRKQEEIVQDLITAGMEEKIAQEIVKDVAENPLTIKKEKKKENEDEESEDEKIDRYIS